MCRANRGLRRIVVVAIAAALAPGVLSAQRAAARNQRPAAADSASAVTAAQQPVGAPVVIRGDTVLFVPARFGSFSAEDRATAIAARIGRLARTRVDSLVLVPRETSTDIVAGETVVMTVSDADAAALRRTRAAVAAEFSTLLLAEITQETRQTGLRAIALGALWTVLATALLAVLLVGLSRAVPRIETAIQTRRTRMPALKIQRLELLSADALTDAALGAVRLLRLVLVVVLLYFYLPAVLGFFPWTRPLSESLVGYVTTPLARMGRAFADYLPNVFFIAVIVVVTNYSLQLIHLVFNALGRGKVKLANFEREWAEPTYKIVRFLVIAFALVVSFPYLPGSKSDAFKGVSLFLGVLFSLGSSSAIANIVAGVVLTYTRAFSIGDRVKIGETTGDVVAKSLLVTRVRTIKNVDVTIPNAMVLSTHILNYTAMARADGLILHTGVTIGYDAPWKQVHELLVAAASATPGILKKPEPFVLQTSLDDFYVSYQLNAYTDKPAEMASTYSALHANIQDKFNEAGVEIMSPHYASLRDGNMSTILAANLPKDYVQPPFRVQRVGGGSDA